MVISRVLSSDMLLSCNCSMPLQNSKACCANTAQARPLGPPTRALSSCLTASLIHFLISTWHHGAHKLVLSTHCQVHKWWAHGVSPAQVRRFSLLHVHATPDPTTTLWRHLACITLLGVWFQLLQAWQPASQKQKPSAEPSASSTVSPAPKPSPSCL